MILSKNESDLFFSVYDALTDFANGKWGVAPAVIDPNTGFVNEENQRKVAERLWRNKQIIAEFVRNNPYSLSSEELAVARTWEGAFTDSFYVVQDDNDDIYFLSADAAFQVSGITREVISMLSTVPTHVSTTLLPFKDRVVYGIYLTEYPVLVGPGLRKMLGEEWQRMKREGLVIRSGQQLIEAAADLEDKRISREAERMLHSIEADMKSDEVAEGSHRGVLSGLSAEERKVQVEQHVDVYPDAESAMHDLKRYCMLGEPERDLHRLLMEHTRDDLMGTARNMGLKRLSKLNKKGLAELLVQSVTEPKAMETMLCTMDPEDFACAEKLYLAGGVIEVPAAEMKNPDQFISYMPCICYSYLHDGTFTFAMPVQTYEACNKLDWNVVRAEQRQNKLTISVANMLVELRGALPLEDMYVQYRELSDRPMSMADVIMCLSFCPRDDYALYEIWLGEDYDDSYLVHCDLADSFDDDFMSASDGGVRVHQGELPAEIDDLFAAQEGKQPRPITEEMATVGEFLTWAGMRPAVVAMRDYLDAHVPDGEDDYTYADNMVNDLIIMCTSEYSMQSISQYLSGKLALAGIDQLNKVMELFSNMSNALPKWGNNGWSPNELREGAGCGKVFYNDDGSPKRVGPYDPCPCGSGKMYKDCHGR